MKRSIPSLAGMAALAASSAVAHAQILDANGNPNTGFAGFYAWFDATGGPNGGTIMNGDAVTTWIDATGNVHDLVRTNADATRQPVWNATSAFGQPAVEFDGDDYIWGDSSTEFGTMVGAKTIFVLARTDFRNRGYVFDSSSSGGRNALFAGQSTAPDQWQLYAGSGSPAPGPIVELGVWQIHTCLFDVMSQEHFIDGTSVSLGAEPTAELQGFVVGSRYTVNLGHEGAIAEILVYEGALSSSDRSAIEGYLGSRYGVGTIGTNYCTPVANSTGAPAAISALGSSAAANNDVTLVCESLPMNSFGYFLNSQMQSFVMMPGGSQGNLCLGGSVGRYSMSVLNSGASDSVILMIDLANTPTPTGGTAIAAGETWNFTYWYRDANPTVTSNFSDGLELFFN